MIKRLDCGSSVRPETTLSGIALDQIIVVLLIMLDVLVVLVMLVFMMFVFMVFELALPIVLQLD